MPTPQTTFKVEKVVQTAGVVNVYVKNISAAAASCFVKVFFPAPTEPVDGYKQILGVAPTATASVSLNVPASWGAMKGPKLLFAVLSLVDPSSLPNPNPNPADKTTSTHRFVMP